MSYMKRHFEENIDEISDQDLFDFGCETQEEVDELRKLLTGKSKEEHIVNEKKWFAIEWGNSCMMTFLPARNKDEAISLFKADLLEDYRDDPDLIVDIKEL